MLASASEEIQRDRDPLLTHRSVRLSRRQAEALARHLDRVVNELEPADSREPLYGVMVSVYRR